VQISKNMKNFLHQHDQDNDGQLLRDLINDLRQIGKLNFSSNRLGFSRLPLLFRADSLFFPGSPLLLSSIN
jgi:hypothetical protein